MKRALLLLALTTATPCPAAPLEPWVGASGSYNSYAMDDVNAGIQSWNASFGSMGTVDEIESGFGLGLSVGADLDRWSFALGYERLPAATAIEGAPPSFDLAYDLAADALVARVVYRKPVVERVTLGFGAGAGLAKVSGEFGITSEPFLKHSGHSTNATILGPRVDVTGTGACFEGFLEGSVALGGKFSLIPSVGYRWSEIDGEVEGSEGSGAGTFDFSGMAAHLGLRFAL